MTIVAVGLHIFDLTGSTTNVALVGVFALVPMIVVGIYGGVLADSFDRRTVALISAIVAWASTIGLALLAWFHVDVLAYFYLLTTLNAMAATVIGATRAAIMPRILPASLLPSAAALGGISVGVQVTLGPALAGVMVATVGFQWTYTVDVILFLAAFTGIATLPRIQPEDGAGRPGFSAVVDGLRFLRTATTIRMSFLVDIVAMTFGMPRVIYPAVGALLIGGGAITVGVLSAAFAVGALASSLFSGRLGNVRWQGRAIRSAITVYGVFIALFGVVLAALSTGWFGSVSERLSDTNVVALVLAALALAGAGAADNVSSVFRSTMMQSAVPDAMRGRTQGVFTVVVTGGPRLGDAYVGLIAATTLLWLPAVLGGILIVVLITVMVARNRNFREYDALNPVP